VAAAAEHGKGRPLRRHVEGILGRDPAQDMFEAFWVRDLTDIRWEMQRMRNLKPRLIEKAQKEKSKFARDVLYATFQAEAVGLTTWRGSEPLVKAAGEDTAKHRGEAESPDASTKRPGESEESAKDPAKAESPTDADTKPPGRERNSGG